jgi:serine/threonine protein kinase
MTATITCAGCQHAYIETALFCPNCGRPKVREALADPLLGKLLGERFLVQELLGQGGSGTIYRAEHVTLRRKVAIKVLHTELSRDDLAVERFRREATTVAEIDNEHIVEIHDFGRTPDGRLYLAMELLEGETLDTVLVREKQLSVERTADILIQVGEALMEAHAIGYVHRDLRPRNIYLSVRRGKANFIKLLDFGLAKLVETEGQAASTSLGMTFGDPRYMSPEQARGDRIDRRADIYQLGCVAYEMLTGGPPFSGTRVFDILTKQVTEAPHPLPTRRPGVPLWMEAAVAKMLAKDPENRFATTSRMVEALRRGLDTGEVMEDDVARRRESIPPPSVSRVMQRMGIAAPLDAGGVEPPLAPATTSPAPSPAAASPPASAPAPSVHAPPAAAAPAPFPPAAAGAPGAPAALGAPPAPLRTGIPPGGPAATMRAPGAPPPSKPDSVELLRKRTGTPRIGVPIVPLPDPGVVVPAQAPVVLPAERRAALPPQPAVAGVIDPVVPPRAPAAARSPSAPPVGAVEGSAAADGEYDSHQVRPPARAGDGQARGKRQSAPPGELNISQVWYDEGEQLSDDDDAPAARAARARKLISPSVTDLSYYEDRPRRRLGVIAVIGVFAVIGGTMAFALTRGGSSTSQPTPPAPLPQPVAAAPIDAAPSTILAAEPTPAEPTPAEPTPTEVATTPDRSSTAKSSAALRPAETQTPPTRGSAATRTPGATRAPAVARRSPAETASYPILGSEPTRRAPALTTGTGAVAPPAGPPGAIKGPSAPSVTDSPQDPYGADTIAPSDGVAPEKKAEFFANLGGQQLISGDTAGAAANFKKAIELDGKNVAATLGMGEIALRQGLFGDAIAHLTKATKLAPKSAKAFTLLGEAYLNSGNNTQAAAQFKKALQLDPDNARARDGYNEASSRVPPPDDEAP